MRYRTISKRNAPDTPPASLPSGAVRLLLRAANAALERLGTLLLFSGLALLLLGAGVQISRSVRVQGIETERIAPSFNASLRNVAPAIAADADEPQGGPPVRIGIPSIGLDAPVVPVGWEARIVNGDFQGNEWETADFAAGYHETSALPGSVGNTVISGHNNIRGAVFKDLFEVNLGDRISLQDADGRTFHYEVVESFVVREEGATEAERRDNTQWIRQTPDERLTLVSCFPPWSNTHRIIVLGFPTADDPPTDEAPGRFVPGRSTPVGR